LEENLYKNFLNVIISKGAEKCTFKAVLKAIKAYFKAVFRTEQIREHVTNALKMLINLTTTISSIINASI